MEIISKISKGTKMDQVYIPKIRNGMPAGSYVVIRPLNLELKKQAPILYNIKELEPVKIGLIEQIFSVIDSKTETENIIITGSFLEKGFNFNDIDVIIIAETQSRGIEKEIKEKTKIETHVIFFDNQLFIKALKTDPIYRLMLSKCISRKRLTPLPEKKLNYRYLDAQLIKSKSLILSFDYIDGKEKYKLTRNLMAIHLFVKNKTLSINHIEKEIKKQLGIGIEDLKNNLTDNNFLRKYKTFYNGLEGEIIKNAGKQEKAD